MLRILCLCIIITFISARVHEQTFTFSTFRRENGWIYLDKMVLPPGTTDIEFKTWVKGALTSPIDVDFSVINQTNFNTESFYKCNNNNYQPALSMLHTLQPNNNPSVTRTSLNISQEQIYYFLMRDCHKFISSNTSLNTIVVSTSLIIKINDQHLGSEEDTGFVYPITMVLYGILIFIIHYQKPLQGDKNWFKFILMLGMIIRFCGLFWKCIGLLIYSSTGSNYTIFQIFYLALHGLQECVIISLIILVGFGWNMLFVNHPDFDIFMTLLALLSTLNIILNVLNVINDDNFDKYHMYDTIPSIIQTAFRIISLFCFVGGIKMSWDKLNQARRSFMVKFSIFGCFYILSLPITLIVVRYLSKSNRAQFVVIMSQFFQLFSVSYLTYMCAYKKSGYNKVSIQNNTFLPMEQNQKYF